MKTLNYRRYLTFYFVLIFSFTAKGEFFNDVQHSLIELIENEEKTLSAKKKDSTYVYFMTSGKGKDRKVVKNLPGFSTSSIDSANNLLYLLDTANKKTIIFIAKYWYDHDQGKLKKLNNESEEDFKKRRDEIYKKAIAKRMIIVRSEVNERLNASSSNISIMVCLKIMVQEPETATKEEGKATPKWDWDLYYDELLLNERLTASCQNGVVSQINTVLKDKNSPNRFTKNKDNALKWRAKILWENLKDCKKTVLKEIVIHYQRKGRNEYRTWGTYSIVGTNYSGFVLERPKGDAPTTLQSYKRHPAGTFYIGYSEDAGGGRVEFYDVTLYLTPHPAYKIHGGNRADDSDGCLLINNLNPKDDSYPRANKYIDPNIAPKLRVKRSDKVSVVNTYYDHDDPKNPAFVLRQRVYEMEKEMKETFKLNKIVKKIIIDESLELEEL